MQHPTPAHIPGDDLHDIRAFARLAKSARSGVRYKELLDTVGHLRTDGARVANAIDSYLLVKPDKLTSASIVEHRKALQAVPGPSYQSADNLREQLARTVLSLADIYDLMP